MTIHEPATLATDYLLALVAGGLAWRLHRCTSIASPAVRGWVWTFGFTALSAIVGGSYHGFAPNFSDRLLHGWWLGTLWLVSLSSAAMATSWVHEVLPPAGRRLGFILVGLRLLLFGALTMARPTFAVVILDYGSSLLLWLGAALLLHRAWRGWMLTGLAFSVIAALVQQLRLAPGEHFNHNDLYHLIQALGLVALSRAATRLESV